MEEERPVPIIVFQEPLVPKPPAKRESPKQAIESGTEVFKILRKSWDREGDHALYKVVLKLANKKVKYNNIIYLKKLIRWLKADTLKLYLCDGKNSVDCFEKKLFKNRYIALMKE
jgi:hypothetical protein